MRLAEGLGELTYCLNIHPTGTWAEIRAALEGPARRVRAMLCPGAPFAIGLRIPAAALAELAAPGPRAELKAILAREGFRAITVNGFPYGPFHGTPVKDQVYQPDWLAPERLAYTCALADLMAEIAPPGETVSLSTVPGTFRPLGTGRGAEIAASLRAAAAHCAALRERTGVTVALAIEPEPFCFLETIAETAAFFRDHLHAPGPFAGLTGGAAGEALRRHLGLCYDVCHAAVEFEDPAGSLALLREAGIPVHKLQLSAALRIPAVTAAARGALAPFAEPTYLHQVVSRRGHDLIREPDLPLALARGSDADGEEWRVHFHVPVFLDDLGPFASTQDFLRDVLALHRAAPVSAHLEVETYTWDVLPAALRTGSIEESIVRELRWVMDRLA